MALKHNKSEHEIRRKIADEWFVENHISVITEQKDVTAYSIGKVINKIIDNSSKFTNQQ